MKKREISCSSLKRINQATLNNYSVIEKVRQEYLHSDYSEFISDHRLDLTLRSTLYFKDYNTD